MNPGYKVPRTPPVLTQKRGCRERGPDWGRGLGGPRLRGGQRPGLGVGWGPGRREGRASPFSL